MDTRDNHCEDATASTESDYPDDEIMEALKGKEPYLSGMFDNYVGETLELRSGDGGGWVNSEPVCGEHVSYIQPRSARNTRGTFIS